VCTRGSDRALLRGPSTSPLDAMEAPWWKSLSRITWWIFSRIWAPLMAVGWPILALYGALQPSTPDLEALRLRSGEAAILVGSAPTNRSYVVLPRDLPAASVSVVEESADTFVVSTHPGAGLGILFTWVACVYGTWYFWIRRQREASNNRWRGP
jgi:hypothetical protein